MATQYKRFTTLLKELELYEDYFPALVENGFDDWEAVTYLSEANLAEIGNSSFLFSSTQESKTKMSSNKSSPVSKQPPKELKTKKIKNLTKAKPISVQ